MCAVSSVQAVSNRLHEKLAAVVIGSLFFSYIFLRTLLPFQLVDILFLGVLIYFAPHARYSKDKCLLLALIVFFQLTLLVSALVNYPDQDALDYMRLFTYLFILAVLVGLSDFLIKNQYVLFFALKVFLLLTAFFSLVVFLAFVQFYIGKEFLDLNSLLYVRSGRARAQGLFDNPNYFSFAMFLAFVLSVYTVNKRIISYKIVFLILLGGLATLSRGYILGLFSFFFVFICLKIFSILTVSCKLRVKLVGLSLFSLFPIIIFITLILTSLQESVYFDSFSDALDQRLNDRGGGISDRFESAINWYKFGASSIQDFLFGNGVSFFKHHSSGNHAAHNTFIRILGEYGFFSLVSFVLLLVVSMHQRLILKKTINAMSISVSFALILTALTNDYYLLREFWLILFFIYFFSLNDLINTFPRSQHEYS